MRMPCLQVLSDIHTEFDGGPAEFLAKLTPEGVDILVVAGDLTSGGTGRIVEVLDALARRYPHVVYVHGNHEVYGLSPGDLQRELIAWDERTPRGHFLTIDRPAEVLGLRFVGATGWLPPGNRDLRRAGLDFHSMIEPETWLAQQSAIEWDWLEAAVPEADVVVTHFVPTLREMPLRWAGYGSNWYFRADHDALIERSDATLWACGHTHDPFETTLGRTRVVCNPRGYPWEARHRWNANYRIFVEPRGSSRAAAP